MLTIDEFKLHIKEDLHSKLQKYEFISIKELEIKDQSVIRVINERHNMSFDIFVESKYTLYDKLGLYGEENEEPLTVTMELIYDNITRLLLVKIE